MKILINSPTSLKYHGLIVVDPEIIGEWFKVDETYFPIDKHILNPTAEDVSLIMRELIEDIGNLDCLTLNKKEMDIILEALSDSKYSNISHIRKFMINGNEDLIPSCNNKIAEIEQLKTNILKQIRSDMNG